MKDTRAVIVENERMFDVYQSASQSTRVKVNKKRKKALEDRSPDIFDTEEEGGKNEEYVEEQE